MGGTSYNVNPLLTLKMVSASSIFGEPQYYREGQFAAKNVMDGQYYIYAPVNREDVLLGEKYEGMKTSDIMEKIIDEALNYDFTATLEWAVELRNDYYMRLNPQIIMVRAAIHPERETFNVKNPGKFKEMNRKVMRRADEPSAQATYWLYKKGSKNGIPSILKRSWKERIESSTAYELAKYKKTNIGLIDTVRISHANNKLVNELMKEGKVEIKEEEQTWNNLRSKGESWNEILEKIDLPHMALLRNLRGIFGEMENHQLCVGLMEELKRGVKKGKQFPFRYYNAYKVVENSEVNHKQTILDALEDCIDISRENMPKMKGKTISLSDNSGSAWGAFNSEYGTVTVGEINNLSSVLTAKNAEEGYIGIFGDKLEVLDVSKQEGSLKQTKNLNKYRNTIGGSTENGVWLFLDKAIKNKEHWDNIFIYSDMQAGHGGLYGIDSDEYSNYKVYHRYIDVLKLIREYRSKVNPKVNVFTIQTAGYDNVVVPENLYRTAVLYGWTGKETVYANEMNKLWDQYDENKKK